jgi:GT2 family glycosyltransferase
MDRSIWIIVLAWNNYADTAECIQSLLTIEHTNYQIVLVDNGSTDGTQEQARRDFPNIAIVRNEANLGVPGGYNAGFRYALERGADGVIMLNNDTVVDPALLRHFENAWTDATVGMLVPIVYFYDRPDQIWSSGGYHRSIPPGFLVNTRRYAPNGRVRPVEYAIGCCILVTREAIEAVGLLDETICFMWEDFEWSERVRKAGKTILQVPQATVLHKVSRSTQPTSSLFWRMHGESATLFFRRHARNPIFAILFHLGYFALREFGLKRQPFGRVFWAGIKHGMVRELRPIPTISSLKEHE